MWNVSICRCISYFELSSYSLLWFWILVTTLPCTPVLKECNKLVAWSCLKVHLVLCPAPASIGSLHSRGDLLRSVPCVTVWRWKINFPPTFYLKMIAPLHICPTPIPNNIWGRLPDFKEGHGCLFNLWLCHTMTFFSNLPKQLLSCVIKVVLGTLGT